MNPARSIPEVVRGALASRATRVVCILVAALAASLWWQRQSMLVGLNIYDEGIILFGASRVLRGELPYRDFWTQYSPGQYYFLATLFAVVGKSVMAARIWDVLTRALLALALAALAVRASDRRAALPVWILAVVWLTYYGFFSYPLFQGLLFSVACLGAFLKSRDDARWSPLAGVLFGLAFVFRHDMAAYLAASLLVTRAVEGLVVRERFIPWLRSWIRFAVAAFAITAPVTLFFAAQVNLHELATQLLIFPLTVFPKVRDLPYPKFTGAPDVLPFYAPFVVYGLSFIVASLLLVRPKDSNDRSRALAVLALAVFGLFGFNQARVRSDLIHTVHFFMLALALLPALWRGALRFGRIIQWVVAMLIVTLVAALLVDPIDFWLQVRDRMSVMQSMIERSRKGPPAAWGLPLDDWQLNVYLSTKFYLERGEPVYFGLKNHDSVFANDVMSYFLVDRPALSRYHELHPGLIETAPVQQEMVAEFERMRPSVIFLSSMFENAKEENDANKDSGVDILDEYIREHYILYGSTGPYEIMRRRKGM